jgi:hypothetical protein
MTQNPNHICGPIVQWLNPEKAIDDYPVRRILSSQRVTVFQPFGLLLSKSVPEEEATFLID